MWTFSTLVAGTVKMSKNGGDVDAQTIVIIALYVENLVQWRRSCFCHFTDYYVTQVRSVHFVYNGAVDHAHPVDYLESVNCRLVEGAAHERT